MSHPLKNKKVLVTGGAGFIGSHITERLVNIGAEVIVLDNLFTGKLENLDKVKEKIRFIKADIRDGCFLDDALEGVNFVCHQAALRSVPESVNKPLEYNEVNVDATLGLFIKAKEKGIKRIVCASSSSVYGERDNFPEKESDTPQPISPYAATKLIVEYYSYLFSRLYNMEIVNLRYFNVYGPRQSLDDEYAVVVPKFINCLLNNERPPIYGDGEQERDLIFIDNVVDINISCLEKDNIGPEVFNVGLGIPSSVNNLFRDLKKIIKSGIESDYCPARLGDVRKTQADIQKAKEVLGWQPRINFYQGLEKTVEWFRKQ